MAINRAFGILLRHDIKGHYTKLSSDIQGSEIELFPLYNLLNKQQAWNSFWTGPKWSSIFEKNNWKKKSMLQFPFHKKSSVKLRVSCNQQIWMADRVIWKTSTILIF